MMLASLDFLEFSLGPGEIHFARTAVMLRTILGSCVGVTFWNPRTGAGALCHGVLPRHPNPLPPGFSKFDGYRYVDFSIRYLAEQFDALGAPRREVEVKVFGGADVLPITGFPSAKPSVGALNCQTALRVLEEEGFSVRASDLGGVRGRTVHFYTDTGEVFVHRLAGLTASSSARHPKARRNE